MSDHTDVTTTVGDEPTAATPAPRGANRRLFMGGGVMAAAAAFIAACSSDDDSGSSSSSDDSTAAGAGAGASNGGGAGGDLAIASAAAGLEVLAVNTYQAAADAAAAGDLGEVPPAVGEYVGTALAQHQEYLDAWNGVLSDAGEPEVAEPPAELETTVNEQFAEVTDVVGAAELALMLENIASQTYLDASPQLESPEAITLAGSIQNVGQQRIAILNFVLGEYPVPDTFQKTEMSALSS